MILHNTFYTVFQSDGLGQPYQATPLGGRSPRNNAAVAIYSIPLQVIMSAVSYCCHVVCPNITIALGNGAGFCWSSNLSRPLIKRISSAFTQTSCHQDVSVRLGIEVCTQKAPGPTLGLFVICDIIDIDRHIEIESWGVAFGRKSAVLTG